MTASFYFIRKEAIPLLNQRQKAFAEYLVNEGLAVGAAGVKAGYSKQYAYTRLPILMKRNVELCRYIEKLEDTVRKKRLMTREDKLLWLKAMIDDPKVKPSDRLKAMDILNKMEAEYLERREISGGFTLVVENNV